MKDVIFSVKRKLYPFIILTVVSLCALSLGVFVNYTKDFQNIQNDWFYLLVLAVATILFAKPIFIRIDFLIMMKDEIYVRGTGIMSWSDVKEVWILNKRGYRGSKKRVIEFILIDETKSDLDLWLLNINEDDFFDALEQTEFQGEFGFEE